jgi:hypothetical protein
VSELEELEYWSPWDETSWFIEPERLGDAPRQARRYHPPTSPLARQVAWFFALVLALLLAWVVLRVIGGGSVAVPVFVLVAVGALGGLVLFGPRLVSEARRTSLEAEEEVALAQRGQVAVARVESVEYRRKKARVGYRDGTDIDKSRGVARAVFELHHGGQGSVEVHFSGPESSLAIGDTVPVLYDRARPADGMAVRAMIDVEFPVGD